MPQLRRQPGAPATARAGVQPGQLPAAASAAGEREALDADDAAGEADQDRREDGPPRPVRDVPIGGGGDPAWTVSGHSASHPAVRRDLPKGRTDMTGRGNGQYDGRNRTRAMVVYRQPSNRPIGHADRRLDSRGGGIQAVADAERLGFLGGCDIFAPTGPGGVAGQSPNGKCRMV